MASRTKIELWNAKVRAALLHRFGKDEWSVQHHLALWDDHLAAGFVNSDFVERLLAGTEEIFLQSVWEMRLGGHLRACGHRVSAPAHSAPDFRIENANGTIFWVEAISPTPGTDLVPGGGRAPYPRQGSAVPFEAMLLRWTSAFKEKAEKGEKYRRAGIVRPNEGYVVAIDASQLSAIPLTHGASRLPFILEVVYGLGPVRLVIGPDDGVHGLESSSRLVVYNKRGAPIPTERFLNPACKGVSAILSAYPPIYGPERLLEVQVAQNPLAASPINLGMFGSRAEEWTAVLADEHNQDGDVWELRQN